MDQNLKLEDKFYFSCHDKLDCFKTCCRDINIFLTPYDVLRMKNKLELTSEEFIKKHTHVLQAPQSGFPVVILKMREDNLVCPFITDYGCQVYHVRPWSCRMAPVEVRGAGIYGIAFKKSHCHGLNESKEWTVKEWMENQGLDEYNEPETLFSQIPLKINLTGQKELDEVMKQLVFLGCYNIDTFKAILTNHKHLRHDLSDSNWQAMCESDVNFMKSMFKWLPKQINDINTLKEWAKILN